MLSRAIACDRSTSLRSTTATGSSGSPSSTTTTTIKLEQVEEAPEQQQQEEEEQQEQEEEEEEKALEKAARAGILLLEKNEELLRENEALQSQLKAFEASKQLYQEKYHTSQEQLTLAIDQRAKSVLENHKLQHLLDQKTQHLQRLEQSIQEKQDTFFHMENLLRRTVEELETYKQKRTIRMNSSVINTSNSTTGSCNEEIFLEKQLSQVQEENLILQMEMKSLKKELTQLQKKSKKLTEIQLIQRDIDQKCYKLHHLNGMLQEELNEEKKMNESLKQMNAMYKQLADSRPFSAAINTTTMSLQDELTKTNEQLIHKVKELQTTIDLLQKNPPTTDRTTNNNNEEESEEQPEQPEEEDDNNNSSSLEEEHLLSRGRQSSDVSTYCSSTCSSTGEEVWVGGGGGGGGAGSFSSNEKLVRKIQTLEEKLVVAKDMLKQTKQQWSAAVASQKALEECNQSAQEEIIRLTHLIDYQMKHLKVEGDHDQEEQQSPSSEQQSEQQWKEETAPYPAPPGDLNSPLIKCLLDHWTSDKVEIMRLTDWLHHAIRGTGRTSPLPLDKLSSEVTAGFTQLLVPILREQHDVQVTIYRRDSVQILSDLILKTNDSMSGPEEPCTSTTRTTRLSQEETNFLYG